MLHNDLQKQSGNWRSKGNKNKLDLIMVQRNI